jgi:DNA-directed RNA polymerase sigma subunit (sigma70/sigma32)
MGERVDRVKLLSVKWRSEPGELTEQQRHLIEFRLQGLGFAEIAKRLNISADRVRELEAELVARVPPSG